MSRADGIAYSILDESATNGSPVTVTFLGAGGPSFTLTVGPPAQDPGHYASVSGSQVLFAEGGGSDPINPQAFGFGSMISSANATAPGGYLLQWGGIGQDFSTTGFKGGNWPQDGSSAYLGFTFTASSQTYTGWAQISADVNTAAGEESAELIDYAYEAGTSIDAGAGAAPEPSSLSLFAIGGAAALALLRRRRVAGRAS
jgi:hypothetical protein